MFVLFIVLNKPEYLPEVLYKMKQIGIRGATVIDSMGARTVSKNIYKIPVVGGDAIAIDSYAGIFTDPNISSDGKYRITTKEVKIKPVSGTDFYPDLKTVSIRSRAHACGSGVRRRQSFPNKLATNCPPP